MPVQISGKKHFGIWGQLKKEVKTNLGETYTDKLKQEIQSLDEGKREAKRKEIIGLAKTLQKNWYLYESFSKFQDIGVKNLKALQRFNYEKKIEHTFLRLQNAIQEYEEQVLKITYVHANEQGERNIILLNNEISSLTPYYQELKNNTRKYIFNIAASNNLILKNNMDAKDIKVLNDIANEANRRREKSQKNKEIKSPIIFWKNSSGKFGGYRVFHAGSIEEAYVSFFVNEAIIKVKNMEQGIKTFVLHDKYGVRKADGASGFFYGDTSTDDGSVQLAVKSFGSATENIKQVIGLLDQIISIYQFGSSLKEQLEQGNDLFENFQSGYNPRSQVQQLLDQDLDKFEEQFNKILGN